MDLGAYKSSTQKRRSQFSDRVHSVNTETFGSLAGRGNRLTINDDLQEKGEAGTQAKGRKLQVGEEAETASWKPLSFACKYRLLTLLTLTLPIKLSTTTFGGIVPGSNYLKPPRKQANHGGGGR